MKRRCTSEHSDQLPSYFSSGSPHPSCTIIPKDFLQKVIDLEAKQFQHFLYNQLRDDQGTVNCNRPNCREERASHRSSLWQGKSIQRSQSLSAMTLYQQVQRRKEELIEQRRRALQRKTSAKETHLKLLKHQKESRIRGKRKNRMIRERHHLRLKEWQEYQERAKSQLIARRLEEQESRIKGFMDLKKDTLQKAELIRQDVAIKKGILVDQIAELKSRGVKQSQILSLISTESQRSLQSISQRHTRNRKQTSLEKGNRQRCKYTPPVESEYFPTEAPKKKFKSPLKNLKSANNIDDRPTDYTTTKDLACSFDPKRYSSRQG